MLSASSYYILYCDYLARGSARCESNTGNNSRQGSARWGTCPSKDPSLKRLVQSLDITTLHCRACAVGTKTMLSRAQLERGLLHLLSIHRTSPRVSSAQQTWASQHGSSTVSPSTTSQTLFTCTRPPSHGLLASGRTAHRVSNRPETPRLSRPQGCPGPRTRMSMAHLHLGSALCLPRQRRHQQVAVPAGLPK